MFRKFLITAAATAALVTGYAATAEARTNVHVNLGFGGGYPGYYGYPGSGYDYYGGDSFYGSDYGYDDNYPRYYRYQYRPQRHNHYARVKHCNRHHTRCWWARY